MATATQIKAFINKLGKLAVAECNRRISAGKGFVLPSVCIAQSALETGWGDSGLMTRANAYFGIKAGGSWQGAVYTADTWEVANGEAYNTTANFRAYSSLADSVTDYYDLIGNNSRYSNALSFGKDASAWKSPKACITAIWAGGYATDTLYVEKIMSTINARNLTEFDKLIDGVSFDAETYEDYSFTASDLKQGKLISTDSGRSIGNDTSDLTAVALDWEKAITITNNATFKVTGLDAIPGDLYLYIVRLIGDTPVFDSAPLSNSDKVSFAQGEKIGFYLTPIDIDTTTLLLDDVKDIKIEFETPNAVIDGAESYTSALAYFVKIE